jgi:hypothetical protein
MALLLARNSNSSNAAQRASRQSSARYINEKLSTLAIPDTYLSSLLRPKAFLLPSFFTPFGFISFIALSPLSCLIFERCGFSLTRLSSLFHPGFAWWDACQQTMPRAFSSATSVLRLLSISTLLSYPLGKTFALIFCISAHQPRLVIQLQLSYLARESDRIYSSILAVHHICSFPDDGYWYCDHFDRSHSGVRCHKLQYRDADASADNRYNDSSSVSNRPNKIFYNSKFAIVRWSHRPLMSPTQLTTSPPSTRTSQSSCVIDQYKCLPSDSTTTVTNINNNVRRQNGIYLFSLKFIPHSQ